MKNNENKYLWWQKGVIYEVYPRSFKDTNGDGVGDIRGVIEKLDYFKWLGVDAIWIGPFYPSPMKDFGYDVSDYKGIHPLFGNLQDFDELVQQAHEKELKVIIDFVPNHTSDQHPWFIESRSSKENSKRNWYLWENPAADGGPPNNWLNVFGGSGWELDEKTNQYYYHAFLKEQPDLNLRNPEVLEALAEVMQFWLSRGVDGLRVDVMWHLIKDKYFRDNPLNPEFKPDMAEYDQFLPAYNTDQAETIGVVAKLRKVMDKFSERVMIGEMYLSIDQTVAYYGPNNTGAHLPGNFSLILADWNARKIAALIDQYEGSLPQGGWPNWVLGNHDKSRIASRVGQEQARVAAMLLLTLRGTPTIYYGDEIGMTDVDIPKEEYQDPQGKSMGISRDPERTPMQWDNSENAGFSISEPWLPVHKGYKEQNVKTLKEDAHSMLNLYQSLLKIRKESAALNIGMYRPVPTEGDILAYVREIDEERFLVVLNFGKDHLKFDSKKFKVRGEIILDTALKRRGEKVQGAIEVKGNEGVLVRLS